jgi:hypothetical protein
MRVAFPFVVISGAEPIAGRVSLSSGAARAWPTLPYESVTAPVVPSVS